MSADSLSEEESEGYFASISDMMVGVLFVFLLMMTVLALNFRDDSAKLDELRQELEVQRIAAERARTDAEQARADAEREAHDAILARQDAEREAKEAAAARERAEREASRAAQLLDQNRLLRERLDEVAEQLRLELEDREAARRAMLGRLARELEARQIQFILDPRSGVLRLPEAILFEQRSSELTPALRRVVAALGEVLSEILPCFAEGGSRQGCEASDRPILEAMLVEGHTDRTGTESGNDQLSTSRALRVFTELWQQPQLRDLRNPSDQPLLGVSGYGQRRPLPEATSMSAAHLAQNRRIDLRFILSSRTSDEIRRLLDEIGRLQTTVTP